MAENAEAVIVEVQADAAQRAAESVAVSAVVAAEVVGTEVAAVGEALEEHAELSEERHTEILGSTEWLQNRMELLLTGLQSVQSTLQMLMTNQGAQALTLSEILHRLNLRSSEVSSPSTPPEAPLAVEPESAVADLPAAPTEPPKEKRRRVI